MPVDLEARLAVGRAMHLDTVAAELCRALRESHVPVLLLKGGGLARQLYARDDPRIYGDVDLLVPPEHEGAARIVVARHGFDLLLDDPDRPGHASVWERRRDGVCLDLHRTIPGAGAASQQVWRTLSECAQTVDIAGEPTMVPGRSATACLVAMHAAQHGPHASRPAEDLRRALDRFPPPVWRDAARVAAALAGTSAFVAALRREPAGAALLAEMGLDAPLTAELLMVEAEPPVTAVGFARLARRRGLRAKLRLLWTDFAPSPQYLRLASPLARRGRWGLVAAYALRPPRLLWNAPAGFLAWRRASNLTRGGGRSRRRNRDSV